MRTKIRTFTGRFAACLLLWLAAAGLAQAMPAIQQWLTANGARVYFVPAPELPMVDIRVVFDAGSARDATRPGLARLTNRLLDKGASGLDAGQIAARLEGLGAELGYGAERDMAWLTLRSLSDAAHFQPAVGMLKTVLTTPDFGQGDIDREIERTLVSLRHSEQEPETIAEYRFFEQCFAGHPYATRPIGSEESLGKLKRGDIQAFYRRYYAATNAVIAIVGAVDRKGAETLAEEIIGQLPAGKPADPLPAVPRLDKAAEVRIFHPATQTHVRMGAPGMRRGDPDYFALYVGNHILGGGGLVSRLSEEIREQRGLSYSVYSYFSPMRRNGPYMFGLQTRNDQTDEALDILRATARKFLEEGPTEKELTASRKNITGGFALRIDSNSKIVEYLAMIGFYGLPLDYLETFNDRVMAVTQAQIRDAFRRRVSLDRMVTVIVGREE